MPKVVVYVQERDAADLEAQGKDYAQWVRDLVKRALERNREQRAEKS